MWSGHASELPRLSDAEFRMLTELLRSHCGLHFDEDSRFLIERRLGRRLRELQLESFTAYHYLVRRDTSGDQELAWMIDALTTNETFFFRECGQLRSLVEEILPERRLVHAGGDAPVNVWSAGCSSGEEPYSVVMTALEAGFVPGRDLRVYASDISRRALQKARRGVYREASLRETDPWLREKYFLEKDQQFRILDDVKKHVHFAHLNLLDESRIALLGRMDVILCRNVIIYFDAESKRRVVATFQRKLQEGGYLLLGHSESLINLSTDFELRHLRHAMVYRKPRISERPWNPWHRAAEQALASMEREEDEP